VEPIAQRVVDLIERGCGELGGVAGSVGVAQTLEGVDLHRSSSYAVPSIGSMG
jgi:hypothetical protein